MLKAKSLKHQTIQKYQTIVGRGVLTPPPPTILWRSPPILPSPPLPLFKFYPTPLPCHLQFPPLLLFLLSCFFGRLGDRATFGVLFHFVHFMQQGVKFTVFDTMWFFAITLIWYCTHQHIWYCTHQHTHTHTKTQRHAIHSGARRLTLTHLNIYTTCYVLTATIFITLNDPFTDIKNLLTTMYFIFKNYSLAQIIYLLSRCYRTTFFLWNK